MPPRPPVIPSSSAPLEFAGSAPHNRLFISHTEFYIGGSRVSVADPVSSHVVNSIVGPPPHWLSGHRRPRKTGCIGRVELDVGAALRHEVPLVGSTCTSPPRSSRPMIERGLSIPSPGRPYSLVRSSRSDTTVQRGSLLFLSRSRCVCESDSPPGAGPL